MFEVYLVGNNSHHFIISPTSVQGKADIRIRVAIPLDYETVDRYDFDVRPHSPSPWLGWGCFGRSDLVPLNPLCHLSPLFPGDLTQRSPLSHGRGWAGGQGNVQELSEIVAGTITASETHQGFSCPALVNPTDVKGN